MKEETTILNGGMRTESVLKIGDKVHRTRSSNYKFIHSILLYLEKNSFAYSPKFIGFDKNDREILTYIAGEVPRTFTLSLNQKIESIKILKNFHDLLAEHKSVGEYETICHNDFAPWNIIVKNNNVVGVIDFDECAPGYRIDDVAYFIWTFLDLGVSEDTDEKQIRDISTLIDTYELNEREAFIPAILKQQNRILNFRNQIILNGKHVDNVEFSKKAVFRIQKSINWIKVKRNQIEQVLKS